MAIEIDQNDTVACDKERVSVDEGDLRVRDVMVAAPKTMPADATVAQLRETFANPHVRMALLVDGTRFAGIVQRNEVPQDVSEETPVGELARLDVTTIGPGASVAEAMAILDREGEHRLVVVDDDGQTLSGLLCLTKDRAGFCQS